MTGLPKGLIADALNNRARRLERGHKHDDIPMLHVSSLIKSDPQNFFCPREFVLRYMERTQPLGAGIPPKFELLYSIGHFYGDYVVRQFLKRSPDWAAYAWGNWTCKCGDTYVERQLYNPDLLCARCGHPVDHYVEVDLFNPRKTVVGHADLILNVDEHYYVYEFKSIERADIVFDNINAPLGDHLLQASNYYWMLRGEGKRVSRSIRFVYIDRSLDGLYTKNPFREVEGTAVNKRRLHAIYDRAKTCHDAIEKGVLPDRLCESITCSRAKQCSKAVSCFNRTEKKIKRIP